MWVAAASCRRAGVGCWLRRSSAAAGRHPDRDRLRGGAVAWVQVKMADTLSVAGVEFRPFLTATTSMDGSIATTYQIGAQVWSATTRCPPR